MRHKVAGRILGRDHEHRRAMRRNMVCSLIEHETISTTLPKAKEIKKFAEKMITLAKKGDLAARRKAISELGDRDIVEESEGEVVKKGTVVGKLFSELGPRFLDRPGGYTRIIKLSKRRLGDNSPLVLLQILGEGEKYEPKAKKKAEPEVEEKVEETEEFVEEKSEETADEPAEEKAEKNEQQEAVEESEEETREEEKAVAGTEEEPEEKAEAEEGKEESSEEKEEK